MAAYLRSGFPSLTQTCSGGMAAHISQWAEEMHDTLGSAPRNLLMKLWLSLPVSEGWVSMFSPENQDVKTEESPPSISLMGGGAPAPPTHQAGKEQRPSPAAFSRGLDLHGGELKSAR